MDWNKIKHVTKGDVKSAAEQNFIVSTHNFWNCIAFVKRFVNGQAASV